MDFLHERLFRRAAVLDPIHREPILAQSASDARADHRVVFGEKNAQRSRL
jgi:hypothetical protein